MLAVAHNVLLIAVFILRARHMVLLEHLGWTHLLLAMPAACALLLARGQPLGVQYTVFLSMLLAFGFRGSVWLVPRLPFGQEWSLLAPYLMVYFAMSFGFVVMSWET
ncbi:MAG: hypothetical protein QHJ34_14905 [bacterium]|nr:hypothetical protein [candidate division KSB1 bacterium]MDH7561491.1 hypothetical protein [bacterium]